MPGADDEELRRRLTEALDKVQPPFSTPRYMSVRRRAIAWRFAPALISSIILSALVVSAYARTGSPNPAVWTETVVNVVAPPAVAPTASPAPPSQSRPTSRPAASSRPSPEPRESPESPEPRESPEPGDTSDSGDSGR